MTQILLTGSSLFEKNLPQNNYFLRPVWVSALLRLSKMSPLPTGRDSENAAVAGGKGLALG